MNSKLYWGRLNHKRLAPKEHSFTYPAFTCSFDLDELTDLQHQIPFFSYNRFNVFSLHDKDYLKQEPGTIKEKALKLIKEKGLDTSNIEKIYLVTSARFLGYVFNPVSFFYCYDSSKQLICCLAEVNNTFGETHLYLLKNQKEKAPRFEAGFESAKEFHVSPFFDRIGTYRFKLTSLEDALDIHVDLYQDDKPVLLANIEGKAKPFNAKTLTQTLFRFPFETLLTVPRIHFHAFLLYFFKKVTFFTKPIPNSPMTIRKKRPTFRQKLHQRLLFHFFRKIQKGRLDIRLPNDQTISFGGKISGHSAQIHIHDYRFFSRLVHDSGIGLGESYMAKEWTSEDPTAVLELLIDNKPWLERRIPVVSFLGEVKNRVSHLLRINSKSGSKKNIEAHYDLGNDFFELILDPTMLYSCGFYEKESDTLEQSQRNKINKIIQKARLNTNCHVLEIGCGWGSFAIEAVKQTGCRVTGLTLSKEQKKLAEERIKKEGLEDKIDIQICDYRDIQGPFDRIVSIEMLEAVGHDFLPDYFKACDRLLSPNGIAVIQVITIPDQRYKDYCRESDFIRKHIFPGGHLPCLDIISKILTKHTGLLIEDLENIGYHYAQTLKEWHQNMNEKKEAILALGYPETMFRAWQFYFSYCEAGFRKRFINDLHLVLTRVGNDNLNKTSSFKINTTGVFAS